jgi:LysM repeat protein
MNVELTHTQKSFAWNPSIGTDCSGLYVYYWVCVGIQPQTSLSLPYSTGNATVSIPPYFTWTPTQPPTDAPMFKPMPTAGALPSNCGAYVQARSGDTCRSILATYTFVTQAQFLSWHPFLNGNCDGLWEGYWYCVMAFDWADLPMPPTVTTRPSPVETGAAADCRAWYFATGRDDCAFIASIFGTFSEADFVRWNPAVGAGCAAIKSDTYYCVGVPGTPTSRTTTVAEPAPTPPEERPTQEGIAANCGRYWLVSRTDTCASIAAHNGVSLDNLAAWNPALGAATGCGGLKPDFYVCVGLQTTTTGTGAPSSTTSSGSASSSTSSSSTAPPSSTTSSPAETTPSPIQDGMVKGCKRFYFVQPGDGCWAIANAHGIALSDFYAWNPAVNNGGECVGLWPDVYVCVGI